MSFADVPIFEALLVPHRSLTRRGVISLAVIFGLLTATNALRFLLLRAWPVAAFSLFETPMVVVLLAINLRRSRASELISLGVQELTVTRTDSAGRKKQVSLPAAWLRVDLHAGRGTPRVVLSSHGRTCEVGTFLHEPDRMSLFEGLRDALYRIRNPHFENPQLNIG